jgi:methylaspartate mutase epsilon subunit
MLRLSEEKEIDMLNGYPLVNHGYRSTRKMMTHFNHPVSLRHGTPDARLLIEIAIASGIFEIEGGPITYLLPYSKNFPLDKAFIGSMLSECVRTIRHSTNRSIANHSDR